MPEHDAASIPPPTALQATSRTHLCYVVPLELRESMCGHEACKRYGQVIAQAECLATCNTPSIGKGR